MHSDRRLLAAALPALAGSVLLMRQAHAGTAGTEPGTMRAPLATASSTSAARPTTKFTIAASTGDPIVMRTVAFMPTWIVIPAPTSAAIRCGQ